MASKMEKLTNSSRLLVDNPLSMRLLRAAVHGWLGQISELLAGKQMAGRCCTARL